jgi:ATP-dependent DNA helicase RecG
MFVRELSEPVEKQKGVGPKTAALLAACGITDAASLLANYPRDWEDRSSVRPLAKWNEGPVCTTVTILAHDWFGFGRMKTLKVYVEDQSARAVLVCFNRPFLQRQLPVGRAVSLWGRFYYKYGEIQSTAFEVGEPDADAPKAGILPVYPLSGELSRAPARGQKLLRQMIAASLRKYGLSVEDEIPECIREGRALQHKAEALRAIHFPRTFEELEEAKRTLIFEELFYLETIIARRAFARKNSRAGGPVAAGGSGAAGGGGGNGLSPLQQRLLARLPFKLTAGQEKAVTEINADIDSPFPAARLLQGDVGSGKTLVAFLAALRIVDGGGQAAVMAPTELLARQHAENAANLLEPLGLRPAFLTGNLKAKGRARLLEALARGEIDILFGTHALFSKDVVYKNLRLAVIDEQHRFGVLQRQAILAKGGEAVPNLLMMSATPIPRSLALTIFGDLDVSVISGMPPGRKPVKTHIAKESNEAKVYDFVRRELGAGRQAYFVFPLIDENESALKDAVSMAGELEKNVFPGYKVALVHSRLSEEEKREAMEQFRRGEVKILAATSVVEVGVDVPNANCMVIYHAERFGLSALHQLRGRVGRGADQAYCFLIWSEGENTGEPDGPAANGLTEGGKRRLKVMLESNDGFVIAEEDLKLRGPGQFIGTEQSGFLRLGLADPVRDAAALADARAEAFAMLEKDPSLSSPEYRVVAEVFRRAPPFTA